MKLRLAIAVLLVLIFSLVVTPTFFIRGFVRTYFNPEFYEGPVVEESYEYLVGFLQKQVQKDEKVNKYFDEVAISDLTRKYFTIDSLREVAQDFISQLNNLTEGRKSNKIAISLLPMKENIPQMADDISTHIIDQIPVCDEEDFDVDSFVLNGDLPECIPSVISKSEVQNPLKRELEKSFNDAIPGEFSLDLENGDTKQNADFKQLVYIFQYAQMILPLFMLIVLLLMTLIIYKPYTLIIKFIGSSFLIGGILALGSGQLFKQVPVSAITQQNFPQLLAAEISELVSFYTFLIQFVVERITVYSVYFIGIGALLILVGLYLSHFYEKD